MHVPFQVDHDWIDFGVELSLFLADLSAAIDRKILADLAVRDSAAFSAFVETARRAQEAEVSLSS